jgi:hypothetical protein
VAAVSGDGAVKRVELSDGQPLPLRSGQAHGRLYVRHCRALLDRTAEGGCPYVILVAAIIST